MIVKNSKNRSKKNNKGNMVLEFTILVIVSAIMIFLVTAFASGLWDSFFPKADKSTLKSVETLQKIIDDKITSLRAYSSSTTNLYLSKDHRVLIFDEKATDIDCSYTKVTTTVTNPGSATTTTGTQSKIVYRPVDECKDNTKPCICIYEDEDLDEVLECMQFKNKFNLDVNNDFNKEGCNQNSNNQYITYIVGIKNENVNGVQVSAVYLMKNNETNRALDADWKIPRCKVQSPSQAIYLCSGKKDGDIVSDVSKLDLIYSYCQGVEPKNTYKSVSVKCVFDENIQDCNIDCSYGDIAQTDCKKWNKCEDYNYEYGISGYVAKNEIGYNLCKNNAKYCNFNSQNGGCKLNSDKIYACKYTDDGSYDSSLKCTIPQACILKPYEDLFSLDNGYYKFLKKYDETSDECKKAVTENFYEASNIYACKEDKTNECKTFVDTKTSSCELKVLKKGAFIWLTHHISSCSSEVLTLFDEVNFCETMN